jgi:predicted NAD/FAD-binding protein
MKQEAIDLLSDRNVQVYFLVLGLAIYHCVKLYYKHSSTARTTSIQSNKPSMIPPLFSLAILSITWFLILRFILANLHTSTSYFDDAYKDVLRDGHYFTSTHLLSWAIVAVIWVEDVTGHTDIWNGVPFLLFGFLGAMGSSFVLWSNLDTADARGAKKRVGKRESTVPITYVFTSTIAFISILKLQPCDPTKEECTPEEGFGTFHPYFRQWLQCLHIFLLAPILISLALPKEIRVPRIPSTLLFGVLAAVCTCWQIHQIKNGARFVIPMTDCQLSITTDLVCCSCITLYAIYTNAVKVGKRDRLSDEITMHYALQRMCLSAILMPLVSPAAVLAGHLCLNRFGETYSSYISWVQQQVAFKLSNDAKIKWCNLGLWLTNDCDYNQACTNLAHALGKLADLNCHDAVLSCGCGSIDEVRFFKHEFKLKHATGIDPHLTEARMTDKDDYNVRAIRASVDDLAERDSDDVLFPPRLFNKIVALDNIYHYRRKEWFLRDCIEILPAGGVVAVSDIVLKQHSSSTPLWIKALLRLMGVETNGLWSIKEYKQELARKGFDSDVNIELIGRDVYKGWSCLPKCLLQYLDYALIVAKKPGLKNHPTKKRIAIIGSGLAGLSTAHYLLSSRDAAEYDVDIYEANTDSPGLAGNTHLIGDQLVDIPARMACLGYYNEYKKILDDLDIPSTIVRTDSSFYGDDGNGMHVFYSYDQRSLVNIYNAIFVGGIRNLLKMLKALNILDKVQTESQDLSFGEWLKINLGLPETKTYRCEMTGRVKQHDLPSLICHNNPFIYVMVGALSWMLSCTWEALLKYPADIVLPYCRGLKMSRLGSGREGQVVRIVPSIKVLERTLLYGVSNLYLGSRVTELDSSKCINGTSYDAVVIATEAKAVEKVTKNASSVFGKIEYHPSTIYLHTDDSFMPQDKKHWRCWNVDMSSGRPEPQLTFWLNEFYPDSHFDSNVFQTWAPSHQPKEGTIIKRSDFERVRHIPES